MPWELRSVSLGGCQGSWGFPDKIKGDPRTVHKGKRDPTRKGEKTKPVEREMERLHRFPNIKE